MKPLRHAILYTVLITIFSMGLASYGTDTGFFEALTLNRLIINILAGVMFYFVINHFAKKRAAKEEEN